MIELHINILAVPGSKIPNFDMISEALGVELVGVVIPPEQQDVFWSSVDGCCVHFFLSVGVV